MWTRWKIQREKSRPRLSLSLSLSLSVISRIEIIHLENEAPHSPPPLVSNLRAAVCHGAGETRNNPFIGARQREREREKERERCTLVCQPPSAHNKHPRLPADFCRPIGGLFDWVNVLCTLENLAFAGDLLPPSPLPLWILIPFRRIYIDSFCICRRCIPPREMTVSRRYFRGFRRSAGCTLSIFHVHALVFPVLPLQYVRLVFVRF